MAIVCKKRQRDTEGKRSEFYIRGRLVSIEDVHRYLKRRRMSVEDAIARRVATPPNIRCYTPKAVPCSPTNPEIFETHQRILVSIRSYVLGSVESRMWFRGSDDDLFANAKSPAATATMACINSLFSAYSLLQFGSFQKVGNFLVKGSAVIQDVLLEECPRMLAKVFEIMFLLRKGGWIDCSNIILNQFSKMAATVLIEMHPLRTLFECLVSYDLELAEDVLISAWESFTDVFEQIFGSSSLGSIQNRADYVYGIIRGRDPDLAEAQLRSMVEKCKEVHGNLDIRYMEALCGLSNFLLLQLRFRDAAAAAEEVIHCASESQDAAEMWCYGMRSLADCQYCNCDSELAESTLRQVIDVCGKTWGRQDTYTLWHLTSLEQWLTTFGKDDEAAEVSEQIAEILRQSNDFV